MDTRDVVMAYFEAWTTHDVPAAFACLAPDLQFVGPNASYQSAEEFRPALERFAAMTRGARVVELIVSGDRAALLYECDLPPGTIRIASFFRVTDGKIRWYETQFDASKLR
jgi:ketosteroid isomerase-like protein